MAITSAFHRALSTRIAFAAFFVFDQSSGGLLGERLYMDHAAAIQQLPAGKSAAAR
jgi:hypothetical protein